MTSRLLILFAALALSLHAWGQTTATVPDTLPDTLAALPAPTPDYAVLNYLQNHRTPVANRVMIGISNTFVLAPLPAAVHAVAALASAGSDSRSRLSDDAFEASLTMGLCAAATMGLKNTIGRPRPWVTYRGRLVCLQHVASASFPSGHTSFTFAAATSMALLHPQWYCVVPAYLWATAVGFSRLYIGAHYPSDVLAGALVGVGSALLSHYIRSRLSAAQPDPVSAATGAAVNHVAPPVATGATSGMLPPAPSIFMLPVTLVF